MVLEKSIQFLNVVNLEIAFTSTNQIALSKKQ
ncbi:uncharacterized protein METZ01_LOCUS43417 [marine metagenome]|uniref:Uncharacterized protein n=1 Tax=marine metagenome TaxID=408172 RepID=A0A381RNR9_9ZZZZ